MRFRDRTREAGLAGPSRLMVGFGALFEDLDGDGALDLFVANGHIVDDVERHADNRRFEQPNQLYLQTAPGRFESAPSERVGAELTRPTVSRGTAVGELDGDGRADFAVVNNDGPAELYFGRGGEPRTLLRLRGPAGNPRGVGTSVIVELGERRVLRRIERARSYAGSSAPELYLPAGTTAVVLIGPGGERSRHATSSDAGAELVLELP